MRKSGRTVCNDLPSSELDLMLSCSHTKRCLLNAGISTLTQLMALSKNDLLQIRGIGQVIADDIVKTRAEYCNSMMQD
ncbi:MAG: hypothetical protein IJ242_04480 [Clostridia bacterium]|nr:hypothetical protein [Clostridia bacterium]